mmetsp:Transcript_140/g.240  ORF Transcript_140/g.240 Transcript_140/m.240 type:complete len:156 (+) Transcript_140:51-518(+)
MGNTIVNSMSAAIEDKVTEKAEYLLKKQKIKGLTARNTQMSMQLAMSRERMMWFSGFLGVVVTGLTAASIKRKAIHPGCIALLPLGTSYGYMWDAAYGTKINRCREESKNIIEDTSLWFVQELEDAKKDLEEYEKEKGIYNNNNNNHNNKQQETF